VHLRADQQNVLVGSGPDVGVRDGYTVNEASALLADIETGNLGNAECALDEYASARKIEVGRQGRVDDEIDVARREAGALDRFLARRGRQRGSGLALGDPAALLDAGALDDPLVRGLHPRRKLVVGDDARWHAHADAQDAAAMKHGHGYHDALRSIEYPLGCRGTPWWSGLGQSRDSPR
jgi:hypothetical protein